MFAPLIIIELVVCLTAMLTGCLVDEARAWSAPSGDSSGRVGYCRGPRVVRATPAVRRWTALVTSALIATSTAGFSEAPGLSLVRPYVRGKILVVLAHVWGTST